MAKTNSVTQTKLLLYVCLALSPCHIFFPLLMAGHYMYNMEGFVGTTMYVWSVQQKHIKQVYNKLHYYTHTHTYKPKVSVECCYILQCDHQFCIMHLKWLSFVKLYLLYIMVQIRRYKCVSAQQVIYTNVNKCNIKSNMYVGGVCVCVYK